MIKIHNIKKINRIKTTFLIMLLSIILSILITFFIMEFFGDGIYFLVFFISVIAPALIAPSVTWYIVSLLIKISNLEEEQRTIATYDLLTGLLNRRAFFDKLDALYQLTKRRKSSLSIAYVDIDNFKKINDMYGHSGGDAVLESFGSLILGNIRKSDLAGRIGGEEFLIVLPETNIKNSSVALDKIRKRIKGQIVKTSQHDIKYSISIGLTEFNEKNLVSLEKLIAQADGALYKAKKSGKDKIIYYH